MLYFRLPQDGEKESIPFPNKLRFAWDKNNELDVDIDTTLNQDTLLSIFYRLELVDSTVVTILADSIYHDDEKFVGGDRCWVDIDFHETKFPFYNESMGYPPQDSIEIDINGDINYKWRVVANNYSIDELGGDPFQISSGWDSTNFKIVFLFFQYQFLFFIK